MKALLSRRKTRIRKSPVRRRVDLIDSEYMDFDMEDWDEEDFETDEYDSEDAYAEFEDEYDDSEDIPDNGDMYDEYEEEYDELEDEWEESEDAYDESDEEYDDSEDEYDGFEEYDEPEEAEEPGEQYDESEEEYGGAVYDGSGHGRPRRRRGRKKKAFALRISLSDGVLVLTTLLVAALAVTTGSLYVKAKAAEKQIAAFAEIGEEAGEIEVIGESGLLAIADAQAAKLIAAEMERQEQERAREEEKKKTAEKTEVIMNMTSIQKDLKIKFINKKSERLVPSVAFVVELTGASGQTITLTDDDGDGIIYEKDMTPGKYRALITGPADLEEYSFSGEPVEITVKDTIEYKKVDVADEVKSEAQVNVKAEDTKVNETVVESANTDTVEWVESTRTLIEGTEESAEEYEAVDRSRIADPALKAAVGFRFLSAVEQEESPTEPPAPEPTKEPASDPTAEPTIEPAPVPETTPAPEPVPTETPTAEPTGMPSAEPAGTPTAVPAEAPTESPTAAPTEAPTESPTTEPTASPEGSPTPSPSPTAESAGTPSATPTAEPDADIKSDTVSDLLTTGGDKLYVKDGDGNFREAKYADFYNDEIREFFVKTTKTTGQYRYTGWQTIDGATYYYDKNGNPVTGEQVIQGAKYTFNENGVLNTGSGHLGIDVSKWNGSIDWNAVKNSGVSYVIIRCGYRGSSTGALIEDPMFRTNIKGAQSAGLKVGVYFFTQAVNEVEAVEEASMVLGLIKGYNISYPVFLDVEPSNGRGDSISADMRTGVCKAFCQTIQNSGYRAGIYANKTWLTEKMHAGSLTGYKIWLAQYAASPTYSATKYDLWQYSSKGSVAGISGGVDMNISYLGY